jgi:hypothetical protein
MLSEPVSEKVTVQVEMPDAHVPFAQLCPELQATHAAPPVPQ